MADAKVTDPALLAQLNGGTDAKVTDPETLAALNADVHPDDVGVLHSIRSAIHGADPWIRSIANGMTLGLADRFAAGMGSMTGVGGKEGDYAGNLKSEQDKTDQFATEHPVGNAVAQTAGAIVTLPLAPAARLVEGATLGAKTLAGMGAGAALGGAQGAFSSKDLTDLPQTVRDAVFGAGAGSVLGGAAPIVGRGVGAGVNWVADALRSVPGVSRGAATHLLPALEADGPAAVRARLEQLGPDATLADSGDALLGKAQGASLNSDEGRTVLKGALDRRNAGTNARIQSDVNAALGPAEDPQTVTNAIRAHRTEVDNAAYPQALENAPPVRTAPILTQLQNQIPRAVGNERRALENLQNMLMTTERRPLTDAEGFPQYDSLGRPRFQDVPVSQNDAEVLHKVKGELDNVIEYDAPGLGVPAGALQRQQGALKWFRGQLNSALENQVPGYREANRASAALARRGDAVQAGTQYLGSGKTTPSPERFAEEFNPLSQGEKIAFAKGSRGNIDRVLGTKANDLQALRGELQGEGGWNTAKIATVHGQDAADQLMSSVDRNLKFRDTHNKVVENSQTAQRQAAAKAMKPDASSETPIVNPNMTVTGLGGTIAKKGAVALANALLQKDPTKSYGEVARILSASGPEARQYLNALSEALYRQGARAPRINRGADQAALAAGMLGGRVYVGHRSASRQDTR